MCLVIQIILFNCISADYYCCKYYTEGEVSYQAGFKSCRRLRNTFDTSSGTGAGTLCHRVQVIWTQEAATYLAKSNKPDIPINGA